MQALLGTTIRLASALAERPRAPARACGWPEIDALLPDGGMPHAVVELSCASATLAGATRIAARTVRTALEHDARSWCAWIDAEGTLFAPGLARAGVDLGRLLVVRPPPKELPRVVVKTASSGAFDVLVVEVASLARGGEKLASSGVAQRVVRKLALAAEKHGTSVLLLAPPHPDPWPVALRLEIARTIDGLDVRVTKDRFGRVQPVDRLAKTRVPIPAVDRAV